MSSESWHGTTSGYSYHGCRCDRCRAANKTASNTARARRYAQRVLLDGLLVHPDAKHGSISSYKNLGCRCLECTAANSASRMLRQAS